MKPIYLLAALLLTACSVGKYKYVDDAPRDEALPIVTNYSSTILPADNIYIHVDSKNPQSVVSFNQETNRLRGAANTVGHNTVVPGYDVSSEGDIIFPILGRIHAEGMTMAELTAYIEGRLVAGRYVKDPQVTARLTNFRVTVIGEVTTPQQIHMPEERLTIFEALAICGDVTLDGMRDRVTVIRSVGDGHTVDTVDLTSRSILDSPYYYLHQNDIVYVEPTKKKKRTAWRNEDWPHYFTTGAAALRMAYVLYYRIARSANQLQ